MSEFTVRLSGNVSAQLMGGNPCAILPVVQPDVGLIESIVSQEIAESGVGRYSVQFGDADLSVAGILVTQHNLNLIPAAIAILDANGEWIYPDRIEALTATTIAINLESFRPLQSSWRLVVSG